MTDKIKEGYLDDLASKIEARKAAANAKGWSGLAKDIKQKLAEPVKYSHEHDGKTPHATGGGVGEPYSAAAQRMKRGQPQPSLKPVKQPDSSLPGDAADAAKEMTKDAAIEALKKLRDFEAQYSGTQNEETTPLINAFLALHEKLSPFGKEFAYHMKHDKGKTSYWSPTAHKQIALKYAEPPNKPAAPKPTTGQYGPVVRTTPSIEKRIPGSSEVRPQGFDRSKITVDEPGQYGRVVTTTPSIEKRIPGSSEVRPQGFDRSKIKVDENEQTSRTIPSKTPQTGGDLVIKQGSTGKGDASGLSGTTGPDYSPTTPKQKPTPTTPKTTYESGGKRNKMSEENNPLIAAFLKLQEANKNNMFEAAKKMKEGSDMRIGDPKADEPLKKAGSPPLMSVADPKGLKVAFSAVRQSKGMPTNEGKNDGNLANNYPPYDKVTRGDVIAGRLGKDHMGGKRKMAEGMLDPKDPSVQTSRDVTSTPRHVKPSDPERIKNFKDPKDPSYQGSGEVTKGGKPVSVREAESFLQRMNPFYQLGKAIPTEPKKPEQDMRIMVSSPPKKSAPTPTPPQEQKPGFIRGLFTGGNKDIQKKNEEFSLENFIELSLSEGYDINMITSFLEENYQLDELSRKTLMSYKRKATTSADRAWAKADKEEDKSMSTDGNKYPEKQKRHMDNAAKHVRTWGKRDAGLKMATKKLAREEVEFSESEIEYFNSVMEAEPVSKKDVRDSDQTGIKNATGGELTDEVRRK